MNELDMDALLAVLRGDDRQDWAAADRWPTKKIAACANAGVFAAMLPANAGGWGWPAEKQCELLIEMASADLDTTFVITQLSGAVKRVASSANERLRDRVVADLLAGRMTASIAISQLTTSGQHLDAPEMVAHRDGNQWRLSGRAPWVTGAAWVDAYVVGAVTEDGQPMLAWVGRDASGVQAGPGVDLVALTGSRTDAVMMDQVRVAEDDLVTPPAPDNSFATAAAGGLQTSALAVGLARAAAIDLATAAEFREDLREVASKSNADVDALAARLRVAADRGNDDPAAIRLLANELVLRVTQAGLVAAKGAGFVADHRAGQRCRQSLFFLVWSCPPAVQKGHLCGWS